MSELTQAIKTAGYISAAIHPVRFVERRVQPITALFPLIQRCKVSLRGWDYPHISRREPDPVPRLDFIERESNWDYHLEAWRFYQSGQFTSLRAMTYDWRNQSGFWPADAAWQRGQILSIEEALFTFAEIFELAARLATSDAGDELMRVSVVFGGLMGRSLVVGDPRRGDLYEPTPAAIPEFPQTTDIAREELIADPRRYAIQASQELFRRFGEELRPELLRDWLAELVRR